MNREEIDRYLRQITPREKKILEGTPQEELKRQDISRFAKAGQGAYLFEGSLFMAPGEKIVVSRQDRSMNTLFMVETSRKAPNMQNAKIMVQAVESEMP